MASSNNSTLAPAMPPAPSILSLPDLTSQSALHSLLSTLFEPTPTLETLLVPSVLLRLTARMDPPASYAELVDICEEIASGWTWSQKAEFLSGHPMIGDTKASGLSGKEQGRGPQTPAVILARLEHLNQLYCKIYPGLRFITFVNSRPRSAVVTEMEELLGIPVTPQPIPDDFSVRQPALNSAEVEERVKSPGSQEWKQECDRGLGDIWRIGKARLGTLGLQ